MRISPFFALLIATALFAQNKVETKTGTQYYGVILVNDADTIVMQLNDSSRIYIPKGSIATMFYNVEQPEQHSFWSVGATVGIPTQIAVVGSYETGDYGARISISPIGNTPGGQVNIFRKITRAQSFSHELSAILGFTDRWYYELTDDHIFLLRDNSYYVGMSYAAHWHGFFGEVGIGTSLSIFNFEVLLQFGYIHEFR